MGYIIGILLLLVGVALGIVGERTGGSGLLLVSGLLIAAAVTLVLLTGGGRGGRGDEPSGHINP